MQATSEIRLWHTPLLQDQSQQLRDATVNTIREYCFSNINAMIIIQSLNM